MKTTKLFFSNGLYLFIIILLSLFIFSCNYRSNRNSGKEKSNENQSSPVSINPNSETTSPSEEISYAEIDKTINDSISKKFNDSILALTSSPFFMGYKMPSTLQATAIQINSLAAIVGYRKIKIPIPPFQEDYFKSLKEALSLGSTQNLNYTDELCSFIDETFTSLTGNFSNASQVIDQLIKYTMSAKMRAVRFSEKDKIKFFNSILKNCQNAKKYINAFSIFFQHASSIKDCLKIIIRAMEPLQTFEGAEKGLQMINDNSNGLAPGIHGAINDILEMIRDVNSTFIINLKNSNSELFNLILDLGQQLFDNNAGMMERRAGIIFGKKYLDFLKNVGDAQDFIWSIAETQFPADQMLDQIIPAYKMSMLENGIHKVLFENLVSVKLQNNESKDQYIHAFKILMLIESVGWDKQAAFFSSLPPSFKMEQYAATSREFSQNCFYFFNKLKN